MFGSLWKMSLWQCRPYWGFEVGGVHVLSERAEAPGCVIQFRWPYWEHCKDSVAISAGSLGRSGQDFSENLPPGFSARWSLEVPHWAAKAEFTMKRLIQNPWKIMETIKGSGKILCQAKTKLNSGGDFPWSCKLPARLCLCLSEHSPFIFYQANLWNTQALILTLFRLMETWRNFF